MHSRSSILASALLFTSCLVLSAFQLAACSSSDGVPSLPAAGGSHAAGSAGGGTSGATVVSGAGQSAVSNGGALAAGGSSATQGAGAGGASTVSGGSGGASNAGAGGSAGSAVSAGGSASGSTPTGPSAGCGMLFADPFSTAVEHDMMVTVAPAYAPKYVNRKYYTQLPKSYDPSKPVPIVFYGQGCGQSGPESSGFTNIMEKDGFILVQMIPVGGCFEAGKSGSLDSPDGPYFDQALSEVESNYCIDKSKVYVAGWSSGAWISTYLACTRGGVVRSAATVAGGLQHAHGTCLGGAAMMMYIGTGDTENGVVDMVDGFDVGTGQSRDIFIKANGCSATSAAWDAAYPTCQIYGSCANPVIWCPVPGGHGSGNDQLPTAAWQFWGSLK